jgi:hypothetical protein
MFSENWDSIHRDTTFVGLSLDASSALKAIVPFYSEDIAVEVFSME